jgi:membrane-associated phospholipid phosphatase
MSTPSHAHSLLEPALLEPAPRAAQTSSGATHAARRSVAVVAIGYVTLTLVLLGIGFLLTHTLNNSVGRWDERVNAHLAQHRTSGWNSVTKVATAALNTLPVVLAAAALCGFLALRHRFREAVLLLTALVLEIAVFLSVTFVVARPRPYVVRLNSTPSTSSFPSGHTAAATVLFVGLAVIVTCCTTKWALRILSYVVAAAVAALVGFARVYRGLHHPTDVFVGCLFGLACVFVAALAVRAFRRPNDDRADRVDGRDDERLEALDASHPTGAPERPRTSVRVE